MASLLFNVAAPENYDEFVLWVIDKSALYTDNIFGVYYPKRVPKAPSDS